MGLADSAVARNMSVNSGLRCLVASLAQLRSLTGWIHPCLCRYGLLELALVSPINLCLIADHGYGVIRRPGS
jgi:hypothetical protein